MPSDQRLRRAIAGLLEATWVLAILLAAIPLTLWYAWVHFMSLVNSVLETLLCVSFGWVLVSLVLCFRSLRELGLSGEGRLGLYSGPRPSDPDELRAWRLGWHFMFGVLATMLCMIAIPVAWWLSGK